MDFYFQIKKFEFLEIEFHNFLLKVKERDREEEEKKVFIIL